MSKSKTNLPVINLPDFRNEMARLVDDFYHDAWNGKVKGIEMGGFYRTPKEQLTFQEWFILFTKFCLASQD